MTAIAKIVNIMLIIPTRSEVRANAALVPMSCLKKYRSIEINSVYTCRLLGNNYQHNERQAHFVPQFLLKATRISTVPYMSSVVWL
jgi:hypothetical protein